MNVGEGSGGDADLVSIIIPTRNSARTLKNCLDSISRFTEAPYEILIVDYHSTDGTVEIGQEHAARIISSEQGRSEARNLGAKAAHGSFLLFLDSDMRVNSDVVAACLRKALSEGADAVTVPEESVGDKFWSRVRKVERSGYRGGSPYTSPAFIRRDVFLRIGGFDPDLVSGEDYDLDLRLHKGGSKVVETEQSIIHDEGELNFPSYMRKSYFYGRSMSSFIRKQPRGVLLRFIPIRPGAISRGIRNELPNRNAEEKGGIYILFVPILKIFQMIFFLLGILVNSFS